MRVLVLTLFDDNGASSRERFLLYFDVLKECNIEFIWRPLLPNDLLKSIHQTGKSFSLFAILPLYGNRLIDILQSSRYDIIWLEYEAFPLIPFWLERLTRLYSRPVVVGYDDAIFHKYDAPHISFFKRLFLKNKIKKVMRASHSVVAGNAYLKAYAEKAQAKKIFVIPTVVDTKKYQPACSALIEGDTVKIGWLGSPSTQHHLNILVSVIKSISQSMRVEFHVMGANKKFTPQLDNLFVHQWSQTGQLEFLKNVDIGVMPLVDELFARGKCGYKLIQYMAFGKPVVGTPLGANRDIIDHGINGFYANDFNEWLDTLETLCINKELRVSMGENGRKKVEQLYSIEATFPMLLNVLENAFLK